LNRNTTYGGCDEGSERCFTIDKSENEWILRADDIIKQFDDLDPESFTFRYPVKRDGAPSLADEILVDPAVVSQIMSSFNSC